MKQLQSERVFLNMAGKESSQTVRLTLHLQDDVDGAVLKDFYGRLCARNTQSKMIGVTATMRKLLLLIYSLWKSGEKYDPTRDKPACDKQKKEAETTEGQPHGIDVGTSAEE